MYMYVYCVFSQVEGDGAEPTSGSDRLAPVADDAGTYDMFSLVFG